MGTFRLLFRFLVIFRPNRITPNQIGGYETVHPRKMAFSFLRYPVTLRIGFFLIEHPLFEGRSIACRFFRDIGFHFAVFR